MKKFVKFEFSIYGLNSALFQETPVNSCTKNAQIKAKTKDPRSTSTEAPRGQGNSLNDSLHLCIGL